MARRPTDDALTDRVMLPRPTARLPAEVGALGRVAATDLQLAVLHW
jgi:hypothetical protein